MRLDHLVAAFSSPAVSLFADLLFDPFLFFEIVAVKIDVVFGSSWCLGNSSELRHLLIAKLHLLDSGGGHVHVVLLDGVGVIVLVLLKVSIIE